MPYTIEDFLGTTHSLNTLLKMNEKPRKMKGCYLCKLKILSSSYGSPSAAINAFQELKIVKFADPLANVVVEQVI